VTTLQHNPGTPAPAERVFHEDGGSCPWHPLPEDAVVQLVAIERRAMGSQPARVIWSVLIRRDATTLERHDLPPGVYQALARDGGERVQPMSEIPGRRLNAAVERATGRSRAEWRPTEDVVRPALP
jgi:hypothetical protein